MEKDGAGPGEREAAPVWGDGADSCWGGKVPLTPPGPGEERSFPVRFRRAAAPPVDLYYLLDLSYSMRDDLGTLRRLARDVLGALRNATPAARIGFGSFVDKPVLPYVSTAPARLRSPCPGRGEPCDPPRAFRHLLPLTADPELFAQRVGRQRVSGNLDAAEGGFDAIVQVAQCQERVGWRAAARLLLFASDDTFHAAGDGKLGGIVTPCDGRCHLDPSGVYASSHLYDYPSVGHVAQVLSAADIQPIFAVTGPNVPIYQELSRLIPRSVVRELRDDSSNVVELIADAYSTLLSTVELQHSPLPPGISLSLEAHCGGPPGPPRPHGASCTGVRVNQEVTFTVRVRASACLESPQRVTLRALGVPEELALELGTLCACPCAQSAPRSARCHGGALLCGLCRCPGGRRGRHCECAEEEGPGGAGGNCPPNSTSAPCSGACERHQGLPCGGPERGECVCGTCRCRAGFGGRGCGCPLGGGRCLRGGRECSGHGSCECGTCRCHPGYEGPFCARCPSCHAPCRRLRDCADCGALGRGPLRGNCSRACPRVTARGVPAPPPGARGWCRQETPDGRVLLFLIEGGPRGDEWDEEREVTLLVWAEEGAAALPPALVAALLALGLLALGLLALALARAALELRGRRESRREQNNPLFRSATSTTANPGYRPD